MKLVDSVVPFPGGNIQDIPQGLRNLAEMIELGGTIVDGHEVAPVMNLVWCYIDEDGEASMGALGRDIDKWRACGIFQHAATNLLTGRDQ